MNPNISNYVSFAWYEVVCFCRPTKYQKQEIRRWYGMANNIGFGHVFHILTLKGTIIEMSIVTHLAKEEINEDRIKKLIKNEMIPQNSK